MIAAKYLNRYGDTPDCSFLMVNQSGDVLYKRWKRRDVETPTFTWATPKLYDYDGYPVIELVVDYKRRSFTLSRLVYCTFIGLEIEQAASRIQCLDGNPYNCHLGNLQLIERMSNVKTCKTPVCAFRDVDDNWIEFTQKRTGHGYELDTCEIHHDGWKYVGLASHQSE